MSRSTLTVLDPGKPLAEWLRRWGVADRVKAIVVHHTEQPTGNQYQGVSTIKAIRQYHMDKGWSDIGANLYACPDGTVVTGRPLDEGNWSHANISLPWSQVEGEAHDIAGDNRQFFNHHGIGIETVANFDDYDPWQHGPDAESLQVTLACCVTICQVFGLGPEHIFIHRDVADKTCPGMRLKRADIRTEVARLLRGATMPDVDEWAKAYVERAIAEGLMTRGPDGRFRGTDPITRQEVATVAVRLLDKVKQGGGGTQ